ncbi:hypothetical protein SPI_06376 [Niveomyces insectorum RCEF 264]|uniref:Uncharacterized protein n=1 Tax=Niveomyces insectorum RCEF 264 TaxID=1081102 RepID=A0A167S2U6_9HYPO|nr:hypothetical protein SPI_06376 [Niveomyces insectorum RCEF 264]
MEQTTPPFGEDVFPAVRQLASFLEPYVKPSIVIGVAFSLPYVLSHLRDAVAPQIIVSVQLLAVAYLAGFWTLPRIPANFAIVYAAQLQAVSVVWSRIGTYVKVGVLLLLACYIPVYYGLPLAFQPWLQGLVLLAITVVGFFAPTAKFVGPVRFAYLHHATHLTTVCQALLDWWGYAALVLVFLPIVLPAAGLGLGALLLAAAIHVYREYNARRAAVAEAVAKCVASAALSAAAAQDDAKAGPRLEAQLISAATTARHEAVRALLVQSTDFFDSAATAWAAVGSATQPAEDAVDKAQSLLDAANEAAGSEKPDEDDEDSRTELLGQYLAEAAQAALDESHKVVDKLRTAQEAISRSQAAAAENQRARVAVDANATSAVQALSQLAAVVRTWPGMAFEAAAAAAATQGFADRALSAATAGEMAEAWVLVDSAKAAAADAKTQMDSLRAAVGNGQQSLLSWLGTRPW